MSDVLTTSRRVLIAGLVSIGLAITHSGPVQALTSIGMNDMAAAAAAQDARHGGTHHRAAAVDLDSTTRRLNDPSRDTPLMALSQPRRARVMAVPPLVAVNPPRRS